MEKHKTSKKDRNIFPAIVAIAGIAVATIVVITIFIKKKINTSA